jgi:hypothetical protein
MVSPLVSVLMPVFNGQRYLEAALASILGQTLPDFEFVVVDDGSTDGTAQILKRCADPRVRVHRIEHAGLIPALNVGVERCSAPFIARMDSDDISYPNRLAQQWEFLETHPDVDVATCWCDLLDESGNVVGQRGDPIGQDMILELAAGNTIVHGSVMLRRASLPPPPIYPKAPEDYWLWTGLARSGKRFHCVPEALYGFRTHGERYSLTHARSQSAAILDLQWQLLEECSGTRQASETPVRCRLIRGWGSVAGAAYRARDPKRGDTARKRFLELAGTDWSGDVGDAVQYGIESMIWGGVSWRQEWQLRWSQWKRRPNAWTSYRNLILSLPPVRRIRSAVRGDA